MIKKKCKYCKDEYYTYIKNRKFCSKKCYNLYKKESNFNLICPTCKCRFHRKQSHILKNLHCFCSRKCYQAFRFLKNSIERKCLNCGKKFRILKGWLKKSEGLYCSHVCSGKAHSGKSHYRYKNGKNHCIECDKEIAYGAKRCRKCYGKSIRGKNHYNWNNGSSPKRILIIQSKKYKTWQSKIFKRDNFTCQCCKIKTFKVQAHHLEGWHWCKELRFDLINGITLCETCHNKFHKKYWTNWNTTEQFVKFIGQY